MITGVVIVVIIGLVAGLILSVASIVFAVPVDENRKLFGRLFREPTAAPVDFPVVTGMPKPSPKGLPRLACVPPEGKTWLMNVPPSLEKRREMWKRRWLWCGVPAIAAMCLKRQIMTV